MKMLLPDLKKIKKIKDNSPTIEIYRGKEGFKTVLEDVLKEKKDYYLLGYTAIGHKIAKFWFSHWNNRRIKLKIRRYALFPSNMKGKKWTKYKYTIARYLPNGHHTPTSALIYGVKIILFLPQKDDFIGILINSKEITDSYKSYYEIRGHPL